MTLSHSLQAALVLTLAAPAVASSQGIEAWTNTCGDNMQVTVAIQGDAFRPFVVMAGPVGDSTIFSALGPNIRGRFDANGEAEVSFPVSGNANFPTNFSVNVHAISRGINGKNHQIVTLPLSGNGGTLCQEFDPNYTLGTTEPATGQIMTNEWNLVGMTISGVNNTATHPQAVATFDSANVTGGDTDLATPGYGPGNTEAYGKLLIIPENDMDLDMDGLLDDPDDEERGGIMRFDFDEPYRMCSATLVDIDDQGPSEMRFYIGAAMTLETIPVPFQGDNGVQTLTFDKRDVRAFELVLGGSGAIARLGMVPCPIIVNLDETAFGKPLGLAAGTEITNQFSSIGLEITAANNAIGHPDKAILFDSENPTGGDTDLVTPGYGLNNDEALGMVLILAENDVDANMDGLVDDPDDEEFGGQMNFFFAEPVTFFDARVLDVDALERDVFTFFDVNDMPITIVEIGALGDNSVQDLAAMAPVAGVKRILVNFTGSGAFTRLRWCPDSNMN
ncbi:hypothetical protein Poly30_15490 [Planctomycetes bacterium Poly30]|uniref:Uncharacterized protein n=1 Tax=Saltatorellus ferox TaxID=2528018 RepID=A0A518EPN0_9BACT|nr:hypothetical protein Poly30_15490 [Planctomycetes bacterium Poly30]